MFLWRHLSQRIPVCGRGAHGYVQIHNVCPLLIRATQRRFTQQRRNGAPRALFIAAPLRARNRTEGERCRRRTPRAATTPPAARAAPAKRTERSRAGTPAPAARRRAGSVRGTPVGCETLSPQRRPRAAEAWPPPARTGGRGGAARNGEGASPPSPPPRGGPLISPRRRGAAPERPAGTQLPRPGAAAPPLPPPPLPGPPRPRCRPPLPHLPRGGRAGGTGARLRRAGSPGAARSSQAGRGPPAPGRWASLRPLGEPPPRLPAAIFRAGRSARPRLAVAPRPPPGPGPVAGGAEPGAAAAAARGALRDAAAAANCRVEAGGHAAAFVGK